MAYTTIDKPTDYFNTKLYTGNATDDTAITGVGFQPDWTWLKDRTNANHHRIYDSVRGATKVIYSSLNNAEGTASTGLKSFDSDGFTLGTGSDENGSGANFVSWNWLASNTTASNTDGSITSTVSANTTAGFSVVAYSGNSTAGATVGHGLGVAPNVIIGKTRTAAQNWRVYMSVLGNNKRLMLDRTNASESGGFMNSTDPTSSVFSLGSDDAYNSTGQTHIAYCFAEKKGYSKFGSYTGNGNADGTFIYTGFKPAWILLKQSSTSGAGWRIHDNKRGISGNPEDETLYASGNNAESTGRDVDFLSNGFKLRTNSGDGNSSGSTYIYMCFAEAPFVTSTGIPTTAR